MGLTPITEKNFRKKLKGCGIKNYSLIPKRELKEKLGFCPIRKLHRKVEISDDYGFGEIFQSMSNAAKVCQISDPSVIKQALDKKRTQLDDNQIEKNFIFGKYLILMKKLKQNLMKPNLKQNPMKPNPMKPNLKQNPMKPNPMKPNLKQMNPKQIARMWRKIKFLILILNPTQNQMLK